MKNQLRKIESELENNASVLEAKIEERTTFFDEKNEDWQESREGQDYEGDTHHLECALDAINEALREFEEFFYYDNQKLNEN